MKIENCLKLRSHEDMDVGTVNCMTLFKIHCRDVKCPIRFTRKCKCHDTKYK